MSRVITAFWLALAVATHPQPGRAESPSTILPGDWSFQASTLLTGAKNGRQCVGPDQIDDFLSGPHNGHYRCTYPAREFKAGAASFIGECIDKGQNRYRIVLDGHYKPEAFRLSGHIDGTFLGVPISVPVSIDAHRVSAECPVRRKEP